MAGLIELDSFVGKFVRLWQSGNDASLKVESKAGKATVILQLDLGPPHPSKFYFLWFEQPTIGVFGEELQEKSSCSSS